MLGGLTGGSQNGFFLTGFPKASTHRVKRYQDYVLLSHVPSLNPEDHEELLELTGYARNTINLVSHRTKKNLTYPLAIVPAIIDQYKESQDYKGYFSESALNKCASAILSERQYRITFHIVGHGTPNSIGGNDFFKQISPEAYARELQTLFTAYGLESLKAKACAFVFHTCNSAYVPVERDMKQEEVLSRIQHQSFIAKFYDEMSRWGMQDFKVTGYRGYYASIISERASGARIQNSFYNPIEIKDASHGEYTISKDGCVPARAVSHEDLFFPVIVYENPLQQPLTRMSP
jgi:hypothetical protein